MNDLKDNIANIKKILDSSKHFYKKDNVYESEYPTIRVLSIDSKTVIGKYD